MRARSIHPSSPSTALRKGRKFVTRLIPRRTRAAVARTLMTAAAATGATAFTGSRAAAQSYTWIGPASGTWHVPANWSTGTVPNSPTADAVVNGTGTGQPVFVTMAAPTVVRSLTVGGNSRVSRSTSVTFAAEQLVALDGGT